MDNMKAIKENFERYNGLYFKAFGKFPSCWYSYLKWLANKNMGHSFEPWETKEAIKMFETSLYKDVKVLNESIYNPYNERDIIHGYLIIGFIDGNYILVPEWFSFIEMYHVLKACGFTVGTISASVIEWLGL
jgi:hypothetical protein